MTRSLSVKGQEFIKGYESYRQFAYPDPGSALARKYPKLGWGYKPAAYIMAGISAADQKLSGKPWTVGYGFIDGVDMSSQMSLQEADLRFVEEVKPYERAVGEAAGNDTTQEQFDAITSLSYNIGIAGMQKSSVIRAHVTGDWLAASRAFSLWNKSGGRVLSGLTARRLAEASVYLSHSNVSDLPSLKTVTVATVDEESKMTKSPIVISSATAAGASVLGVVAEAAKSVGDIRDSLGESLPYVLAIVVIVAAGYATYQRLQQRKEGWA